MKELTAQQKALYIQRNGVNCPVCESDNLIVVSEEIAAYRAYRDNYCHDCKASFTETFTMTDVELSLKDEESD
jgi:transposase-like protein